MTDDELLALMGGGGAEGTDDDALLAMMGDAPAAAPAPAPAPAEGPSIGQGLKHAAKGLGKLGVGMMDMIPGIINLGTTPARMGLDALGITEGSADKPLVPNISDYLLPEGTAEYLDKTPGIEEGSAWDIAQTGVEWGAAGPYNLARKGARALPDALMAAGAMAGEYIGGDTGEVIGGLLGLGGGLKKGKKGKALDLIEEGVDDPTKMLGRVKEGVAEGDAGTLADLAGEQSVFDVESLVAEGPSRAKYATKEIERQAQIADQVRAPFGKGNAEQARDSALDRIGQMYDQISQRWKPRRQEQVQVPMRAEQAAAREADVPVQQAVGEAKQVRLEAAVAAENARAPMQTDKTLAETSGAMSEGYNAAREAQKLETVTPHWDEFDKLDAVPIGEYRGTVEGFLDDLPPSQKKQFKPLEDIVAPLKDKEISQMAPTEIQDILSDMRSTIDTAYKRGKPTTAIKNLERLREQLDGQLVSSIPSYKKAKQGEAALRTRFDTGAVGEARGVEPELFARTIGQGDEAGAVSGRLMKQADIPGMPELQADRLRALAQRSKSGIDEGFMKEYESLMDSLPPEFKVQAQTMIEAEGGLAAAVKAEEAAVKTASVSAEATEKTVAGLDKAAEQATKDLSTRVRGLEKTIDKSMAQKYVNNREKTIVDALKNPDDVTDLKALMRSMERLGETKSLMANMGDVILEKLSQGGVQAGLAKTTGSAAPLTSKAIDDFQKMAKSMENAGVDPKIMKDVWKALYKLGSKTQRTNARKVIFGSDRTAGKFLDSVAGAAALKILPGSSLIMGGAVRKIFAKLGGSGDRKILAALDDFMLNPDQYIMAAEGARNPTEAANRMARKLIAVSQTIAMD